MAERKRRETEFEDKQRKDDELKKQQRRDALKLKKNTRSVVAENGERKSNKQNKTPEEEEMIEELLCTSLEHYDWLVH